uniref:Uncharacterized protein n=1 Tax=Anguilla anguilla TaxID=7936 RepID=A0A0E9UBZ9_ANGAN
MDRPYERLYMPCHFHSNAWGKCVNVAVPCNYLFSLYLFMFI